MMLDNATVLDRIEELLAGDLGPAIRAVVALELATAEYGDPEQAAEELAGALDLLLLDVVEGRLDTAAGDLVDLRRRIDQLEDEATTSRVARGQRRTAEHMLDVELTRIIRRYP